MSVRWTTCLFAGDPLPHLLHHRHRGPRARRAQSLLSRGDRSRGAGRRLLPAALHVQLQVGVGYSGCCSTDSQAYLGEKSAMQQLENCETFLLLLVSHR